MAQLISTALLGAWFADKLPLAMMLQTMAFVVFNKVCSWPLSLSIGVVMKALHVAQATKKQCIHVLLMYLTQLDHSYLLVLMQVCTAQYFVWWFTLLPLVLPNLDLSWRTGVMQPFVIWVVSQLHWLAWAYMLEFQGRAFHLQVWLASLAMCAATVYLMKALIHCSNPRTFARQAQLKQH